MEFSNRTLQKGPYKPSREDIGFGRADFWGARAFSQSISTRGSSGILGWGIAEPILGMEGISGHINSERPDD